VRGPRFDGGFGERPCAFELNTAVNESFAIETPSSGLIERSRRLVDRLVKEAAQPIPERLEGRGIVVCGGGYTYFTNAWVQIRMLRHLGCSLPVQLWHLGPAELNDGMKRAVAPYGVECVNGLPIIRRNGRHIDSRIKAGWVLKSVSVTRSSFEEVLFLDADNVPVRDPSFLFEIPQYKNTGAIFWPDINVFSNPALWDIFRMPRRREPEFESGQFLVDKRINWEALTLTEGINFRADVFYRLMWGDKDTFRFAWHKLGRAFAMPGTAPQVLRAVGSDGDMLCQHDFNGLRLFQHRNLYKWDLHGHNSWIPGFFFENECRTFLKELRSIWDGRCRRRPPTPRTEAVRARQRALLKNVWLLEVPRALVKNSPAEGSTAPIRAELTFQANGTLSGSAGSAIGYFWDLKSSARGPQLVLSGAKKATLRLRPNGNGWEGRWSGTRTRLLALEEVYPHLAVSMSRSRPSRTAREIRTCFGEKVHLIHTAEGIGDHIAAVYACAGLARLGVEVVFRSRHARWLSRVDEPRLLISRRNLARFDYDLEYDYPGQLRYGVSRASWYAGRLHPLLTPARPRVQRQQVKARLPFQRYILLAPFALWAAREWAETHWTRLAHLLRETGYEVVAIGSQTEADRMKRMFDKTQAYWVTDRPPDWIMDAMLGAAAYVGLDSGMTHLAVLMGAKVVAIHSQLRPEFLWPKGAVTSVAPNSSCVFCRWQSERGWLSSCEKSCSALASVRPESVLAAVLNCTGEPADVPANASNSAAASGRHGGTLKTADWAARALMA
jgi:hypothetical protein